MLFIIVLLFSFSWNAAADSTSRLDWKNFKTASLQLGTWLENYRQVRATRDGEVNGFEFNPYLSLSTQYYFNSSHILIPEVGYVLQRTSESVHKNIFLFRFDYAYQIKEWLRLRAGSSLAVQTLSASGGEETLNNGNTTETYYKPSERSTALNQTLDLGVEFIKDNLSARVSSFIYAFNESEQRLISYTIGINYYLSLEEFWK